MRNEGDLPRNPTNISPQDLSWEDLKMILDYSFDEIYVIDAKGIIIYVNDVSLRHYNIGAEELIGKSYLYLRDNDFCSPPVVPVVIAEKKTVTMEQITRTGKTLTVTATPILKEDGSIRMIVMNSRDITNIIRLKNNLKKSQEISEQYRKALLHYQTVHEGYQDIIAASAAMRECLSLAKRVARFDTTVLLLGESGVGKNILARYIHNNGSRRDGPFITINCASIPENLLESELFGYVKGAFSGANREGKPGLAMLADKGTLFLDEIGDLPFSLQSKILQLVQEHSFFPVGGSKEVFVDIRIIAATNQDLLTCVEQGTFRKDLYYRLDTIKIEIPSLRERSEDIPALITYFIDKYNLKYKTEVGISAEAVGALMKYKWPGNIRELEHVIERLVLISESSEININELPREVLKADHIRESESADSKTISPSEKISMLPSKSEETQEIIQAYLRLKSTYKVAQELNISQSKVARIVKKFRR